MQKARRHPNQGLRLLVGVWVQALFHPSVRSAFHLSFTVLVPSRCPRFIGPGRRAPADSVWIPRVPTYSGPAAEMALLRVRGCHPLRPQFPMRSTCGPIRTVAALLPRACRNTRGLGFSPVARRYWGNHVCFLLLQVIRCFSSLRSLAYKACRAFNAAG